MKRKLVAVLLAAVMASSITACGKLPSAQDVASGRIDSSETEEKNEETEEKTEETEEKTEETEKEEEEKQDEEVEKKSSSNKGVVFGSDEAKGYDGFEYLTEELISTSETKSGNKVSYSAFVPDDYPYVSGDRASGERMGVELEVDIAPYLQYNSQDYTISENLEEYVEGEFSYSSYEYGIEIGEVEEIDDDTAVCVVTYMYYSSYDDSYTPFYNVYKLQDMGDNVMALITISIEAEETTGKTQALLDEISSFYQMDIGWDDSFAETKRTAFENSDEYNSDAFNLVYMSFVLPDGWEKDSDNSSYSEAIFAPGGNARRANGYIGVSKEYSSDNYVEALLDDVDYTAEALSESMGDEVSDVKVEAVTDTFMGEVAKVEMKVYDDDIDGNGTGIVYYGYDDYTVYMIVAFISEEASEEEEADVRAALDMIFETGKLN
ncbi:MAG: hypothetical protein NC313_15030 [Butyrivibrio sp.]|nr:hypothetical protein [Butyrivibrio sp.]